MRPLRALYSSTAQMQAAEQSNHADRDRLSEPFARREALTAGTPLFFYALHQFLSEWIGAGMRPPRLINFAGENL